MNLQQVSSDEPTAISLTPSRDFFLKLKSFDVYIPVAYVSDSVTEAQMRTLFDEVSTLDLPRYLSKVREQQKLVQQLASAGVIVASTTVPEQATAATPEFKIGEFVKAGEVRKYQGLYYQCKQGHMTQGDWLPPSVPALWQKVEAPSSGGATATIAAFVQPTGAQDAYAKGAKVTFKGKTYESLIAANTYSPEAYPAGWKVVT